MEFKNHYNDFHNAKNDLSHEVSVKSDNSEKLYEESPNKNYYESNKKSEYKNDILEDESSELELFQNSDNTKNKRQNNNNINNKYDKYDKYKKVEKDEKDSSVNISNENDTSEINNLHNNKIRKYSNEKNNTGNKSNNKNKFEWYDEIKDYEKENKKQYEKYEKYDKYETYKEEPEELTKYEELPEPRKYTQFTQITQNKSSLLDDLQEKWNTIEENKKRKFTTPSCSKYEKYNDNDGNNVIEDDCEDEAEYSTNNKYSKKFNNKYSDYDKHSNYHNNENNYNTISSTQKLQNKDNSYFKELKEQSKIKSVAEVSDTSQNKYNRNPEDINVDSYNADTQNNNKFKQIVMNINNNTYTNNTNSNTNINNTNNLNSMLETIKLQKKTPQSANSSNLVVDFRARLRSVREVAKEVETRREEKEIHQGDEDDLNNFLSQKEKELNKYSQRIKRNQRLETESSHINNSSKAIKDLFNIKNMFDSSSLENDYTEKKDKKDNTPLSYLVMGKNSILDSMNKLEKQDQLDNTNMEIKTLQTLQTLQTAEIEQKSLQPKPSFLKLNQTEKKKSTSSINTITSTINKNKSTGKLFEFSNKFSLKTDISINKLNDTSTNTINTMNTLGNNTLSKPVTPAITIKIPLSVSKTNISKTSRSVIKTDELNRSRSNASMSVIDKDINSNSNNPTSLKDKLKKVYKTLSTENNYKEIDNDCNKSFHTIDDEFKNVLGNLYNKSKSLKKFELNQMYINTKSKTTRIEKEKQLTDYATSVLEETFGTNNILSKKLNNNNINNTNIDEESNIVAKQTKIRSAPKVNEKYNENNKLIERFFDKTDKSYTRDKETDRDNSCRGNLNESQDSYNQNKFKFFKAEKQENNTKLYEKNSFESVKNKFSSLNNDKLKKLLEDA